MQNYNPNMDSEYADLYSQYTKMHSNSVQMDSSSDVMHYQTNDLKPMDLQPGPQTNSVQEAYGQIPMDTGSTLPSHNSHDISQDLSLSYDSEEPNSISQNNTAEDAMIEQRKSENCMESEPSAVVDDKREEETTHVPAEKTELSSEMSTEVDIPAESLPEESEEAPQENRTADETAASSPSAKKRRETEDITEQKEKEADTLTEFASTDVCRVCMDTGVLISIFDKDSSIRLCEKVMSCAAVQVIENDGLPGFICNSCVYDLEVAFKFKARCEKSDSELRAKLGLKTKTIVKTEFVLIDCENEPVLSEDDRKKRHKEVDYNDEFSDRESDDPPYGSKYKKKGRRKSKKMVVKPKKKIGKRKKRGPKPKHEVPESDDDVIEVTKRPVRKRRGEDSPGGKYPCSHCDKSFPYPSVLKLHMVTHTKEKTHKCVICSKTFMYSKELYTHYKDAHPNEYGKVMDDKSKTYPCGSCDKVFSQMKNLKVHEVVHVREKKYKCEVCSQGFTNMTTLNMHKKQDHPGMSKPYRCTICDKRFKQQAAMERHVDNHRHQSEMAKIIEEKKPPSTKDLFKSIAPVTTTYWSDSFSD